MQLSAKHYFLQGYESGKEASGRIEYFRYGQTGAGRWADRQQVEVVLSRLNEKGSPVHRVHATPVMNTRSLIEIGSDADVSFVQIKKSLYWNSRINKFE